MLRGTLTLLSVSVRADARKRRAHTLRILAVLLILVLLVSSQLSAMERSAPGLYFFRLVAFLMATLITLMAVGLFSSAISEERESGTLSLLLLADLSPLAILFGKSMNRVFSVLMGFVAQLPFALLALTLGGITTWQVLSAYVVLSAYLFLVANMAVAASVFSRRSGFAGVMTTLLLFLLHGVVPWFVREARSDWNSIAGGTWAIPEVHLETIEAAYTSVSVFWQLDRLLTAGASSSAIAPMVLFCIAAGGVCFGVAWWGLERLVWVPVDREARPVTLRRRAGRKSRQSLRAWTRALAWKEFYFNTGGAMVHGVKAAALLIIGLAAFRYVDSWNRADVKLVQEFALGIGVIVLVVESLLYGNRLFGLEVRSRTLSSLTLVPRSFFVLAYEKIAGVLLAMIPTVLYVAWSTASVQRASREFDGVIAAGVIGGCLLIVTVQLVVACSLWKPVASIPLALAILAVLVAILLPFATIVTWYLDLERRGPLVTIAPTLYLTGVLSAGLHVAISLSLRSATAR